MSTMSNKYNSSFKRIQLLLRRLKKDPELLHQYDQIIKDQLKMEVIQIVKVSDFIDGGRVHYHCIMQS
jgi:hypothetical protein